MTVSLSRYISVFAVAGLACLAQPSASAAMTYSLELYDAGGTSIFTTHFNGTTDASDLLTNPFTVQQGGHMWTFAPGTTVFDGAASLSSDLPGLPANISGGSNGCIDAQVNLAYCLFVFIDGGSWSDVHSWFENGDLQSSSVRGTYAISPVPIPPAVFLLGTALVGVAGFKRLKRQRQTAEAA